MKRSIQLLVLGSLFALLPWCVLAFAQDDFVEDPAAAPLPTLYHQPPYTAEDLPNPGMRVELSVMLGQTKQTDGEMLALVVRDGALLQVRPRKVFLNEYDEPEYVFDFHAPQGDINYQFLLFPTPDSNPIISDKYVIRRDCLPPVELIDLDVNSQAHGRELLVELVYRARSLEREYRAYEEARAILMQIFEELELAKKTN